MAIKNQKKQTTIGIEFSESGVRAAKVTVDSKTGISMNGVEEVKGDMTKEEELVKALNSVRSKLNISKKDRVVSCLIGKQLHAAQIIFGNMPDTHMANALRLHIRKTITFEMAGAALAYDRISDMMPTPKTPTENNELEGKKKKKEDTPLMVCAASNSLLARHLKIFSKAGIKQGDVQTFPIIVANALQIKLSNKPPEMPNVVLYFGKQVVSLVIDGPKHQFFHRNIYFAADQVLGKTEEKISDREKERKLRGLGDEIARSLTYYDNNFPGGGIGEIYAFGELCEDKDIQATVQNATSIPFKPLALYKSKDKTNVKGHTFTLAISLAVTGMDPMPNLPRLYRMNLIKKRREQELKAENKKLAEFVFQMVCYGILILCVLFSGLKVKTMSNTLSAEEEKLRVLEREYNKYTATKIFVNKKDIEKLDSLQRDRIFWTNKLASLAFHLPENYWINQFTYKRDELKVSGYGYITPNQEQLITVDDYLNALRTDSMFNDVFKTVYFDKTERSDEKLSMKQGGKERERVSFEYTAAQPKRVQTVVRKKPRGM